MKLTLQNPPVGFKAEAENRPVRKGESFLANDGEVTKAKEDSEIHFIVLTPEDKKFKLFLIEWRQNPEIGAFRAYIGAKIEDYRIVGFTKNPDWKLNALFELNPCWLNADAELIKAQWAIGIKEE